VDRLGNVGAIDGLGCKPVIGAVAVGVALGAPNSDQNGCIGALLPMFGTLVEIAGIDPLTWGTRGPGGTEDWVCNLGKPGCVLRCTMIGADGELLDTMGGTV
jgi:hypothetical protein